jgi:transcriptional regulator with XRE-family HTH domain
MSFRIKIDPRSAKYAIFSQRVRDEIVKAISQEIAAQNLSQAGLAHKIGVSPSVVTRRLTGKANLTLRSIADFAWALDRNIVFHFKTPEQNVEASFTCPERHDNPVFDPPKINVVVVNKVDKAVIAPKKDRVEVGTNGMSNE